MDVAVVALFIPIVSVISFFAFLTVIIVRLSNNRRAAREKLYEIARTAVDKGHPLPPEVISVLADTPGSRRSAFSDLRAGVICLAGGLGFCVFGLLLSRLAHDALEPIVGVGAIPAFIGVALIALSYLNPNKDKKS